MGDFLSTIPAAASSPLALVAYAISAVLFAYVGVRVAQLRGVLKQLRDVPEEQRKAALQLATDTVLPDTVSANDWIRMSRIRSTVLVMIAVLISLTMLGALSILRSGHEASERGSSSRLEQNAFHLGFFRGSLIILTGALASGKETPDRVAARTLLSEPDRMARIYMRDFGIELAESLPDSPEGAKRFLAALGTNDEVGEQLRIKHGERVWLWYDFGLVAGTYAYVYKEPESHDMAVKLKARLASLAKSLDVPSSSVDAFFENPKSEAFWKLTSSLK